MSKICDEITNSVNLPRPNNVVVERIDDMEYVTFSKTHLAFVRLIVVEMGSEISSIGKT